MKAVRMDRKDGAERHTRGGVDALWPSKVVTNDRVTHSLTQGSLDRERRY